jgi:hypothetical protein
LRGLGAALRTEHGPRGPGIDFFISGLVTHTHTHVSQFATLLKPTIHVGLGNDGAAAGAMQHFTLRAIG